MYVPLAPFEKVMTEPKAISLIAIFNPISQWFPFPVAALIFVVLMLSPTTVTEEGTTSGSVSL